MAQCCCGGAGILDEGIYPQAVRQCYDQSLGQGDLQGDVEVTEVHPNVAHTKNQLGFL